MATMIVPPLICSESVAWRTCRAWARICSKFVPRCSSMVTTTASKSGTIPRRTAKKRPLKVCVASCWESLAKLPAVAGVTFCIAASAAGFETATFVVVSAAASVVTGAVCRAAAEVFFWVWAKITSTSPESKSLISSVGPMGMCAASARNHTAKIISRSATAKTIQAQSSPCQNSTTASTSSAIMQILMSKPNGRLSPSFRNRAARAREECGL